MTEQLDKPNFYRNTFTMPVVMNLRIVSTAAYKYDFVAHEYVAQVFEGNILAKEFSGGTRFNAEGKAIEWIKENYTCLPDRNETDTEEKKFTVSEVQELLQNLYDDITGGDLDTANEYFKNEAKGSLKFHMNKLHEGA